MDESQTYSLLQHELLCCRVCLMMDCRLYNIHAYKLADTFTRISGTPVSRDQLPQYLCGYCLVLLFKCSSFRDMCLRTQTKLTPALLKGALDMDYVRKYQLPHRQLNFTQTPVEIIELLPEDLNDEQSEDIVSSDSINETYLEIKPEIQADLIGTSDEDFDDKAVFKDGIISGSNIGKNNIKEIVSKTATASRKRNRKGQTVKKNMVVKIGPVLNETVDNDKDLIKIEKRNAETTETPVKENMVLQIAPVFDEIMDVDKDLIKIEKNNTETSETPVEENIGSNIGHAHNESTGFEKNQMKMEKENSGTIKTITIEIKDSNNEFDSSEKSDNNDDISYQEVYEKIKDVNLKGKKIQNVTHTESTETVIKSGNVRRNISKFNVATFESTYNLKVVSLSKEEQLEEIASRKKSCNYLESPFKCEECGKGYGVESAYNNHRVLHSPSNGPHSCEICSLYFKARNRLHQHHDRHRLKYICDACSFVSRNKTQAIKHHATHTGKTYECHYCFKSFTKSTTYINHMRIAHPELNVDCLDCGETFVSVAGLKQHKKRTHDRISKKFICTICSAIFNSASALNRHKEVGSEHRELRPCEQCGENCASENALREHVGEKHPTESHHCEVCNLAFSNAAALDMHSRRKHLGQRYTQPHRPRQVKYRKRVRQPKPCMCDQCGAILANAALLIYHTRKHLAVKPFACPHCPKAFISSQNLKSHMRLHSGDRPFQCPDCPRAFNTKWNLSRHYDTAHLGKSSSFPCPICDRTSTTKSSLKVHVRAVHGGAGWPKRDRSKRKIKTQLDDQ